jgi:hypothetical protein
MDHFQAVKYYGTTIVRYAPLSECRPPAKGSCAIIERCRSAHLKPSDLTTPSGKAVVRGSRLHITSPEHALRVVASSGRIDMIAACTPVTGGKRAVWYDRIPHFACHFGQAMTVPLALDTMEAMAGEPTRSSAVTGDSDASPCTCARKLRNALQVHHWNETIFTVQLRGMALVHGMIPGQWASAGLCRD